jgi:hypothetical protein
LDPIERSDLTSDKLPLDALEALELLETLEGVPEKLPLSPLEETTAVLPPGGEIVAAFAPVGSPTDVWPINVLPDDANPTFAGKLLGREAAGRGPGTANPTVASVASATALLPPPTRPPCCCCKGPVGL